MNPLAPLALMFPLEVMCPVNVCISAEALPKYVSPLEDICPSTVSAVVEPPTAVAAIFVPGPIKTPSLSLKNDVPFPAILVRTLLF